MTVTIRDIISTKFTTHMDNKYFYNFNKTFTLNVAKCYIYENKLKYCCSLNKLSVLRAVKINSIRLWEFLEP